MFRDGTEMSWARVTFLGKYRCQPADTKYIVHIMYNILTTCSPPTTTIEMYLVLQIKNDIQHYIYHNFMTLVQGPCQRSNTS